MCSTIDIPSECTQCQRFYDTAEKYVGMWSNKALEKQDVRFDKNSDSTDVNGSKLFRQNNIFFIKEDEPAGEDNTVTVLKKYTDRERLAKQRRMQNDIDA